MTATYTLTQGRLPLLISMPHNGQQIPADIAATMQPFATSVPDTDWFLDRLYGFSAELGVSVLNPFYSRYVIDLNRAPDGAVLYAGANNTELCPTSAFDLRPLYREGQQPNEAEIARRIERYWQLYHQALQQELARLKAKHGYAILFEAHSIRSQVPRFFDGQLPDINFGTADGASCAKAVEEAIMAVPTGRYRRVLNGRFKGGYITRHYGQPGQGVHALQLELAQLNYVDENTFIWRPEQAAQIQPVLWRILDALLNIAPAELRG
ncbi:N-formylglutamate deformylase [Permianibacter sp. IMCC34836]|uniref:N-formylglutamate deformylase n=1 Tax=Permianibacter fluminis TaxID=2738515 RepID=UPI001553A6AB|nr:N-formylglutamate deformylase [Permianibacter fluminis]NQD38795.1 N-formylglutamate deformylase [Permianibacter fluminis]